MHCGSLSCDASPVLAAVEILKELMDTSFFDHPILNSPYSYPQRHWELDAQGQPTNRIMHQRRSADFVSPVPKPRKQKASRGQQLTLVSTEGFVDAGEHATDFQVYNPTEFINSVRQEVDRWRALPNEADWKVTAETARLLRHWRSENFQSVRPFFCQVEAVETMIWLTEVLPTLGKRGSYFSDHLERSNRQANPELLRIALKLATGAGKTTVMAMLIAWQTINAVYHPLRKMFTRGFLIVAPGITIRDRLRVLQPNDPDSYYRERELVPPEYLESLGRAKIVITNYHAFKRRERLNLSAGNRALLQGRGDPLDTLESDGQMLQRVMPELMGLKQILVINDEAHHCYRERPADQALDEIQADEKEEAQRNNEAARLWISGLETVKAKLGISSVIDLSATPFFLRGSGYVEGTLFPWTVSDFSLMDAIESGIVKLPRVPVADNVSRDEMPMLRNLWEHIGKKLPKKGRKQAGLDPLSLPVELQTALYALYGHYEKTFELWQNEGISVPPVFIVVCNNTATSKLVYDFISGFMREGENDTSSYNEGRLALFRNFDEYGNRLARPNTLLIDSEQLESGDALDTNFRAMAADEIERFRREMIERSGNNAQVESISDQELLREVMNTVGKVGRLGESVRCVVSVSMLTEGWDVNTVTHVLGVRAFGTQLLCEQVVGRALRRQSYDLNDNGLFNVEYADVLGIPFDFTAHPVIVKPQTPRETVRVHAVRPDRDALEIRFPRVTGYRVELPDDRLIAQFGEDSKFELTPQIVGPSITHNQGIIGEEVQLTVQYLEDVRPSTIVFNLTKHLLYSHFRDADQEPRLNLFGELKRIVRQWLEGGYLICSGGTFPAQVLYQEIADKVCLRIKDAINQAMIKERPIRAMLDAYNPIGSTQHVNFTTSKALRWKTDPRRNHINWVVCDSDWEAEFCRIAEAHPAVVRYVKNQGLGFEVPYLDGATPRMYWPDFIVLLDDGHGRDDLLQVVIEVKGFRNENAVTKANTMKTYWIPGVNHLREYGRWAFAEFTSAVDMQTDFNSLVQQCIRGLRG